MRSARSWLLGHQQADEGVCNPVVYSAAKPFLYLEIALAMASCVFQVRHAVCIQASLKSSEWLRKAMAPLLAT